MKKYLFLALVILFANNLPSQTLIATSSSPDATANHNQRKIVRDSFENIYVVFTDIANQECVIKGVMYNSTDGQWSDATQILPGKNPTLAISNDNQIHMVFESNDDNKEIRHIRTTDFTDWTTVHTISEQGFNNEIPVADIDSSGNLNTFWIRRNNDLTESLVYARISGDSIIDRKVITTKSEIVDITIANHLQYINNHLYFAFQFDMDSLQFFRTTDLMESYDTIYSTIGTQPCITFNSYYEFEDDEDCVRFLHLDTLNQLNQAEFTTFNNDLFFNQIPVGTVDYVCIDDIAPPIGYSYLIVQQGYLKHGFSYGPMYYWNTTLETIPGIDYTNPSIAYKHFNFEYVDFIWMFGSGSYFMILYMRDEKQNWLSIEDDETGKGFSVTGSPNPFSGHLKLKISVEQEKGVPEILIYNTQSQLVKQPLVRHTSKRTFVSHWDGSDENGILVKSGTYIIICTVGDKRTARKVIYQP